MNKFLMLAIAAFVLGTAVPAIADDHAMTVDTKVETSADANVAAEPMVCHDDEGVEMECPADAENHDNMDHEGHMDTDVKVETTVDAAAE